MCTARVVKGKMQKDSKAKIALSATSSVVNLGLGILKLFVGVYTNSISILSDGINNFGDVLSNAGAAVGFGVSDKRPTEKYPFGFGRVEYVVTFAMAILIVVVGGVFLYSSLDRIFYHPVITFAWLQFGLIAGTIVVKIVLAVVTRSIFKKYPSDVLRAQVIDNVLDAVVTTFALLALFLSRYISFPIDAFIGIVISIVLIAAGLKLVVSSFKRLVLARDDVRTDGLIRLAKAQPAVKDVKVKVYDFGKNYAEANVALGFEENASSESRTEAAENIVEKAKKYNIVVTIIDYKEEK